LDDLVEQVGVSKGAVSIHIRQLERLGMVHKQYQFGDRKDYYIAETDFWKIIKGILQEREKSEFDKALNTVNESLDMVAGNQENEELASFYQQRMQTMQAFFKTLDSLVAAALALEGLVSLSALKTLMEKAAGKSTTK
jgi:DNA-binding transcriptional regulator GbsR (MarR family)